MGQSGLIAGRTYSLSLGSADSTRTIAGIYGYSASGATILNKSTADGDIEFTLPLDVEKLLMRIQCTSAGADEQVDETLYPMLVEGMPAEYVPYALGGGSR